MADLVRVLRVPETLNHKSDPPKRVEVIEANLTRYPLSVFEKYADEVVYSGERIPFVPDPDRIGPAQRMDCLRSWRKKRRLSKRYISVSSREIQSA